MNLKSLCGLLCEKFEDGVISCEIKSVIKQVKKNTIKIEEHVTEMIN